MTEKELKELLESLNDKNHELLEALVKKNAEVMQHVYDLQEFMEDQGLTADLFYEWRDKKDMRMYH